MLKLITNKPNKGTVFDIFYGVEEPYDSWTVNSPTIFEYVKKTSGDVHYVPISFSSYLEKKYMLVYLQANKEYEMVLNNYESLPDNSEIIFELNCKIYNWKDKKNLGGGMIPFSTFILYFEEYYERKTIKVDRDMYCLFEFEMTGDYGDYAMYVSSIGFKNNIPSGGLYNTRYYRNWIDKIDGSKWAINGKVYSEKKLSAIDRAIKTDNEGDYCYGINIYETTTPIGFSSYEEIERNFYPDNKIPQVFEYVNIGSRNSDAIKLNIGTAKIEGYYYSDTEERKRFSINHDDEVTIKINDEIFFRNGTGYLEFETDIKTGYNPFTIYISNSGGGDYYCVWKEENSNGQIVSPERLFIKRKEKERRPYSDLIQYKTFSLKEDNVFIIPKNEYKEYTFGIKLKFDLELFKNEAEKKEESTEVEKDAETEPIELPIKSCIIFTDGSLTLRMEYNPNTEEVLFYYFDSGYVQTIIAKTVLKEEYSIYISKEANYGLLLLDNKKYYSNCSISSSSERKELELSEELDLSYQEARPLIGVIDDFVVYDNVAFYYNECLYLYKRGI